MRGKYIRIDIYIIKRIRPVMQIARARIPPGERITKHRHPDMHECFLVLRGSGRLFIHRDDGPVVGDGVDEVCVWCLLSGTLRLDPTINDDS